MNRILQGIGVAACCVLLFGCGGHEEDSAVKSQPAAAKKPSGNNPFAEEQQTIRDAKSLQSLLDKDAEEKKKAIENMD